jgi:hypothetical protein
MAAGVMLGEGVTLGNVKVCLSNLMKIILNTSSKCNIYVIWCSLIVKVFEY